MGAPRTPTKDVERPVELEATGDAALANTPSTAPAPMAALTKETLSQRLHRASPKLTAEIYDLAKSFVADERARQARLDAKAGTLLSVVGLALTVASTFGGQLVKGVTPGLAASVLKAALALALLFGVVAAGFALRALFVRSGQPGVSENVVFGEAILGQAADRTKARDEEGGVAAYKQSLAIHLWVMGQRTRALQEKKASEIWRGQVAFAGFLGMLLVVFVVFIGTMR